LVYLSSREEGLITKKPEGKRLLGRITRKWEDIIKMGMTEIGSGGMDWIHLWVGTSGGLLWTRVMNIRVPQNVGKFLSS
jgi:hypothetical protein